MAAAAVLGPSLTPGRTFTATPLISEQLATKAAGRKAAVSNEPFNAKKHLAFEPPARVYTMKEIGMAEDKGISPIAVSEPFQMFTPEAIMRMREEVLNKDVLENCKFSSNLAHCQLRGFANKYAPFVYDAWKDPETLRAVSSVAGVDLVVQMDFEIAHINLSVKSAEKSEAELREFRRKQQRAADETDGEEEEEPIVGWHTDSYPFVCVLMLSDCTNMIGGETALRTGAGDILKVRGPQMGCAVVLQGKYIEHQALAALGATERITMVTSFRPRSASVRDDTVLTTVRAISNLPELYGQFSEYRLEILEERIRSQLKEIREARAAGRGVATRKLKQFFAEQEAFLAHMNREMVDDEEVTMGAIDDSHLLTEESVKENSKGPRGKKRARRA